MIIEEDQDLLRKEKEEEARLNQAEVQAVEVVRVVNLIKKINQVSQADQADQINHQSQTKNSKSKFFKKIKFYWKRENLILKILDLINYFKYFTISF